MSYYNTTGLGGEALKDARNFAASQDIVLYRWFRNVGEATPSQAWRAALPKAPLTSVRRSINSLTAIGLLRKTDRQESGIYGRPEHVWAFEVES